MTPKLRPITNDKLEAEFVSIQKEHDLGSRFSAIECVRLSRGCNRIAPQWALDAFEDIALKDFDSPALSDDFSEYDVRQLERIRRNFFNGFLFTTLEAFEIYLRQSVPPPYWVRFGVSEVRRDVKTERTGRRGRPTSKRTRYRRQLIDGLRLEMVAEAQEMQRDARHERRIARSSSGGTEKLDRFLTETGQVNYLRYISDETYVLSCEQLQGTILAIGVEGLRSSCTRAREVRDLEGATGLLKFGLLPDAILRAIGLDDLTQRELQKSRQSYLAIVRQRRL